VANGGNTGVALSPHHLKVKGYSPDTTADTGREKKAKRYWFHHWCHVAAGCIKTLDLGMIRPRLYIYVTATLSYLFHGQWW
jgi:hypothetical protein